jgi:hypothetical protein
MPLVNDSRVRLRSLPCESATNPGGNVLLSPLGGMRGGWDRALRISDAVI